MKLTVSSLIKFLVRAVVSTTVISLFFIFTQDFQIFPGSHNHLWREASNVPPDVQETKVKTSDGNIIPVWMVRGVEPVKKQKILFFHGNAETLAHGANTQRFLANNGYTNYAVEYQGFPGTTGWLSETGIYHDGEAAMDVLLKNEGLLPQDVIIFGNSIGTGPASYIAQKYNVGTLLLLAPYTSLTNVVKEMPLVGLPSSFLWYRFPVNEYIENLKNTCVVDGHGRRDTVIPFHHSEELKTRYRGLRTYTLVASDSAGHNDIFSSASKDIFLALSRCLNDSSSSQPTH